MNPDTLNPDFHAQEEKSNQESETDPLLLLCRKDTEGPEEGVAYGKLRAHSAEQASRVAVGKSRLWER